MITFIHGSTKEYKKFSASCQPKMYPHASLTSAKTVLTSWLRTVDSTSELQCNVSHSFSSKLCICTSLAFTNENWWLNSMHFCWVTIVKQCVLKSFGICVSREFLFDSFCLKLVQFCGRRGLKRTRLQLL